jgi:hypothetical protein
MPSAVVIPSEAKNLLIHLALEEEVMTEDKEALLDHYRQTREDLLSAIEGLSDALLTERSLDGWSVKDHLAHIAQWDDIRASEVARISAGHESAWGMTNEQGEAYNVMAHELRRHLSVDQVRWELETSRERLLTAIAAATARGLDGSLYGDAGLRSGHEAQHTPWIKRWREERGEPVPGIADRVRKQEGP